MFQLSWILAWLQIVESNLWMLPQMNPTIQLCVGCKIKFYSFVSAEISARSPTIVRYTMAVCNVLQTLRSNACETASALCHLHSASISNAIEHLLIFVRVGNGHCSFDSAICSTCEASYKHFEEVFRLKLHLTTRQLFSLLSFFSITKHLLKCNVNLTYF